MWGRSCSPRFRFCLSGARRGTASMIRARRRRRLPLYGCRLEGVTLRCTQLDARNPWQRQSSEQPHGGGLGEGGHRGPTDGRADLGPRSRTERGTAEQLGHHWCSVIAHPPVHEARGPGRPQGRQGPGTASAQRRWSLGDGTRMAGGRASRNSGASISTGDGDVVEPGQTTGHRRHCLEHCGDCRLLVATRQRRAPGPWPPGKCHRPSWHHSRSTPARRLGFCEQYI